MSEIKTKNTPDRQHDVDELIDIVRRVEADPKTVMLTADRVRIRVLLAKLYKDISL
jgi:hypothetical protein